jgi:hypothetical protein
MRSASGVDRYRTLGEQRTTGESLAAGESRYRVRVERVLLLSTRAEFARLDDGMRIVRVTPTLVVTRWS